MTVLTCGDIQSLENNRLTQGLNAVQTEGLISIGITQNNHFINCKYEEDYTIDSFTWILFLP